MMSVYIRRGFISLFPHNSYFLCKCRVPFSTRNEPQLQIASQVPSILSSLKNPQNSNLILSFLKESGFSATQIDRILKSMPELLSAKLDKTVKPKIEIFREFGFSDNDISEIISKYPDVLHRSASRRIIPSLSVLKCLLQSTAEVAKLLKIAGGWYFKIDINKYFVSNVNLLRSCGVAQEKIVSLMYHSPWFISQKHENTNTFVAKADEMGVDRSSVPPESLVENYHFDPRSASQVASVVNSTKIPQNANLILAFLKESGFSVAQMEKIVKSWPDLLSADLENIIKPKIKIFREFGFSDEDIAEIVSKDPSVLRSSASNRVLPSLYVLKGLLGSSAEVAKCVKLSVRFLRNDLHKSLLPNIDLLKSCGLAEEKIVWLMYHASRFLLQKTENMEKFIARADQLGADRSSKGFVNCVRVISSMSNETWELKRRTFLDLGFSEEDILRLFRVEPLLFCISVEKINKLKEVLLATRKYDLSCIVENPNSLTRSVEARYKPRLRVLEVLVGKKRIADWPNFRDVYKLTDAKFIQKFVAPYYDDVGEVYTKKAVKSTR